MVQRDRPWPVFVTTALPFRADLSIDLDRYGTCALAAENGCDGICPNGSPGEFGLTDNERAAVVSTAVDAAPADSPSCLASVRTARAARASANQAEAAHTSSWPFRRMVTAATTAA
jgi:4-hydroxy-tetrahydrodipicolinate synthase